MIGAIAGDVIGSFYDANPIKTKEFRLFTQESQFTDDTVMTVAVAYSILHEVDYVTSFKTFGHKYPAAGYGWYFYLWLNLPTAHQRILNKLYLILPEEFLEIIDEFNERYGI